MRLRSSFIYFLYRASVLYYAWLLFILGRKLWPYLVSYPYHGFSMGSFMVAATQAFLIWVHFAILRGILKKQAMALMTSLLLAGTHSLCALALPNIDFYTRNFLWASILVFIVTMSQFISQLVELRA